MSILFGATYPERVRSLSLYGTVPRFAQPPTIRGATRRNAIER